MTWIELAENFQTAIVGVIGFSGVITAQFVNARLIRKREEIASAARQKAITALVRAELTIMKEAFLRPDPNEEREAGSLSRLTKMKRKATPQIMAELGYLDPLPLQKILYVMSAIDAVYDNLTIIADNATETHIDVKNERWNLAAGAMNNLGERIEDALKLLPK
ncbi:hypothetical protein GLP43_05395 [Sulfitobacter sp. M39]|uniref:hypothetical protein n=1 Tax=Sulfitobacter sp. M39 TaxID=2675334 RepID=UPI001F2855F1|nr:hypothetical protein [Sulfitobacter sp. M39]MCF7747001.1 hypothetical protein [Sulfitobacter sp. M39]